MNNYDGQYLKGFLSALTTTCRATCCTLVFVAHSAFFNESHAENTASEMSPKAAGKFHETDDDQAPEILRNAKWLWPSNVNYDLFNRYAIVRKTFELDSVPERAPLYITADIFYQLWINGEYVAFGPARGYDKSKPFDEIDVGRFLKRGENTFAIRIYNPGRGSFQNLPPETAGVIFAAQIGDKVVLSDGSEECRFQKEIDRDTQQYSLQLPGNQESINLGMGDPEWFKKPQNKGTLSAKRAHTVNRYNCSPHYKFEKRGIPMLDERIIEVVPKLVGTSEGDSKVFQKGDDTPRNIALVFAAEGTAHIPEDGSPEISELSVPASGKGKYRSYVLDFGRVEIAKPIITVKGAKGGETIDAMYSEYLDEKNHSFPECSLLNSKKSLATRLICGSAESQTHQYFHPLGFRYMILRVRDNSGPIKVSVKLRNHSYPFKDRGMFESSDKLANDIWKISKHTQKICSLDAYVDTPGREQAQWWGDARVQAWNTFFLDPDPRLLRRGIDIISRQRTPDGLTFGHAPTIAHECILPDFSLIWMLTLYDYWYQTGDISVYEKHKETVESILSYFDRATNPKNGLVSYDPRYWLFLDWTNLNKKEGEPAILNLWLLNALDKLSEMCEASGLKEDDSEYSARAEKVRNAIVKNLLDPETGLINEGIFGNGKPNTRKVIHAQILGKMNNIAGLDFERAKSEIILPFIKGKKIDAEPSSYWVVYVLKTMIDEGNAKEVYEYILDKWEPMIKYGNTFETFYLRNASSSLSHAWSAHPLFLIPQILCGVKQEGPNWSKISIRPNYLTDSASATFPTPKGDIVVSWKKSPDGSVDLKTSVPKGIEVVK